MGSPVKVYVQPPSNWTNQYWQVVTSSGELFCNTWHANTADGGRARKIAELIAKSVNGYMERNPDYEIPGY
jgi:hypothetical protein